MCDLPYHHLLRPHLFRRTRNQLCEPPFAPFTASEKRKIWVRFVHTGESPPPPPPPIISGCVEVFFRGSVSPYEFFYGSVSPSAKFCSGCFSTQALLKKIALHKGNMFCSGANFKAPCFPCICSTPDTPNPHPKQSSCIQVEHRLKLRML